MAQVVKLKRTAVQGKVPTTSSLELGELAINTYDGRIFFEKDNGTPSIQSIVVTDAVITGSINLTGAVTASYFRGDGSNLTNLPNPDVSQVATVTASFDNQSNVSVTHNFNSRNVIISVYDTAYSQIIPSSVTLTDSNTADIVLSSAQSGFAVVAKGGHIVSGTLVQEVVEVATVTASFDNQSTISVTHSFGSKNILVSVYDTSDSQIIPSSVVLTNTNTATIGLSSPQSGYVVVAKGGHLVTSTGTISYNNLTDVPAGILSGSSGAPAGTISGSSQLTSSYDERYVLSGSITQTTWDNIASKPGGIVSGSSQISALGYATTSSLNELSTSVDTRLDLLETYSGSYTGSFSGSINARGQVDYLIFNSSSAATLQQYMLQANTTDKTLDLRMGNNATLQLGQEIYFPPIVNKSGVDLNDGDLVMVNPAGIAQGNRISVVKAISNGTYPADKIVGILTEDVANNAEGFATWFGYVRNISKTHIQPAGETWTEGDILYPNPAIPGKLTNVFPTAPNLRVTVATITSINGNNVTILVNFHKRTALKRAHDVLDNSTTSSYGDLLIKSGSVWTNKTPTQIGLATTGSNTFVGTQTLSGSIIPAIDNTYDLGSPTYQWKDIYVSSGSLYIDGTKVLGSTGNELQITTDEGQSIKILEAGSDSIILQSADGDIQLKSSGGGNLLFDPTTGLIDVRGTLQIQDGNKITSSGGNSIQFGNDLGITGSINISGNVNGVNLLNLQSSFNTFTGSSNTALNGLNSYTASLNSAISTSGSNVTILGNLSVAGTQTIVNSTTVQIGDNIIELNGTGATNAGLLVKDATAPNTNSGSLLWDSTNDYWKAGVKDSESKILLAGGDSVVSGSSQIVSILSPLNTFSASVESKNTTLGTYTASIETKNSTLATYTGSLDTKNNTLGTYTSSLETKNSTLATYTGSLETKNSTLATYTGSVNTRLTTLEVETSNLEIFTSSINTTIKTRLNAETVVSGSSQITLSSTTGYGSVLNQAVLTTSSPTFAGITINGKTTTTSGGVDGTFADAFVSQYSGNNSETNAIQTSVSSVATSSGFRFQVSNGGGSSARTTVADFVRSTQTFYGNVLPAANGTQDLGSTGARWSTIYTSDLSLNNGIGDWTIVEGEDDLFLYNNKKGKVYKFALTEVDPNVATPKKS
jgi:hypothetical protein